MMLRSITITSTAALSTSTNLRPKKRQNHGMQRSGGGELFSRDHCQLPPPADPNRYLPQPHHAKCRTIGSHSSLEILATCLTSPVKSALAIGLRKSRLTPTRAKASPGSDLVFGVWGFPLSTDRGSPFHTNRPTETERGIKTNSVTKLPR
jgi:hypothetical protein